MLGHPSDRPRGVTGINQHSPTQRVPTCHERSISKSHERSMSWRPVAMLETLFHWGRNRPAGDVTWRPVAPMRPSSEISHPICPSARTRPFAPVWSATSMAVSLGRQDGCRLYEASTTALTPRWETSNKYMLCIVVLLQVIGKIIRSIPLFCSGSPCCSLQALQQHLEAWCPQHINKSG